MVDVSVPEVERHLISFTSLSVEVIEVVARELFECAGTRTVQYRHFACPHHQRIVHIGNQLLQCLISPIPAQVECPLKLHRPSVHDRGTAGPLG